MGDLDGKVALVTGGSRGIGAAIAKRLGKSGADVALTYLTARQSADEVASAIERAGRRSLTIQADSGDASAVARAVDRTVAELGGLDILVNNAGFFPVAPVEKVHSRCSTGRSRSTCARPSSRSRRRRAGCVPAGGSSASEAASSIASRTLG